MGQQTIVLWWHENVPLDWNGQVVAIVGAGPSAIGAELELLRDRAKVIAVNLSWRLAPWADLLYGSDGQFWFRHDGVPEFLGRKATSSPMAARSFKIETVLTEGNNSGTRAIMLAEKLGARRVLLIGYDMHGRGGLHWHEPHSERLHNPSPDSMRLWCHELERRAPLFAKRGLEIINCTPGSALRCFPFLPLERAIDGVDGIQGRTDQPRHSAVLR